jgi:hypothetical protein
MSTAAQIAANIANAQASTGPRTTEGKARSSKNSITLGLFSGDFIRPGEEGAYAAFDVALFRDLAPVGLLEEILVEEIHRAMWRLRRCGEVEAHLVVGLDAGTDYIFDPMETANPGAEKVQRSVDRSRSQAHRLLHKSTAELRKIQTERQYRNETFDADTDRSALGLADCQSIAKISDKRPVQAAKSPTTSTEPPIAQGTQSESAGTPRNAPCPCGSGQKHKRCCGKDAPAVLHTPLQTAA